MQKPAKTTPITSFYLVIWVQLDKSIQNLLYKIRFCLFLRPKYEPIIEFCRTVLGTRYLNRYVKLVSNYILRTEILGIGTSLVNLMLIFSGSANTSENVPFFTNITKNEGFFPTIEGYFTRSDKQFSSNNKVGPFSHIILAVNYLFEIFHAP